MIGLTLTQQGPLDTSGAFYGSISQTGQTVVIGGGGVGATIQGAPTFGGLYNPYVIRVASTITPLASGANGPVPTTVPGLPPGQASNSSNWQSWLIIAAAIYFAWRVMGGL